MEETPDDECEMHIFTAKSLLSEIEARKQQPKKRPSPSSGGQGRPPRLWTTRGEYELIRSGPHLPDDPDTMISKLQERTLTLFRHKDPAVRFGADPRRPLWVGVFRMHPSLGYVDGEQYYKPKQTHLQAIYAADRPQKNFPADNAAPSRIPNGPALPYWIDAWKHIKDNDRRHKEASKMRKANTDKGPSRRRTTAAAPDGAAQHAIPVDNHFFLPPTKAQASAARKAHQHVVSLSTILRPSPVVVLGRSIEQLVATLPAPDAAPPAKRPKKDRQPSPEPAPPVQEKKARQPPSEPAPPVQEKKARQPPSEPAPPAQEEKDAPVVFKTPKPVRAKKLPASGNLTRERVAKHVFLAQQYVEWAAGNPVDPLMAAFYEDRLPPGVDPTNLIDSFIAFINT